MYSLVSAPVLAADLARHPYGARLADAVDRVLALAPAEQDALGAPAAREVRHRVLAACSEPAPPAGAPGAARSAVGATGSESDSHVMAPLEGAALLGSLSDVHAMLLREDPLRQLPAAAQQVALDGVTVAWAGPTAALRDLAALAAPWEAALAPVPPALPETPYIGRLRLLLDQVPRRTPEQWARAEKVHTARRGLEWSNAMHEACVAALATGRVVDAARAQLAAVRALVLTHTGISPYAAGMVVSAAVQATCTADVLDPGVRRTLMSAWEAGALGS